MEESRKIRIVINFEHAQNTSQSDGSGNATVCCRSHLLPKLLRDHRSVPLPAQQRSDLVDLVLIMSVFAGFGGQKFMTSVLPKVQELRAMGFTGEISMDGGISPSTIAASAAVGTNAFVAGTAVFGAADRATRIQELRQLATAARTDDRSGAVPTQPSDTDTGRADAGASSN